ncbi:MAG: ThiF family adenylyltransferase [Desulfurococcales archaeon]|nr:ThiF family adenylyltransferase [Desulfurococcales archaeon]
MVLIIDILNSIGKEVYDRQLKSSLIDKCVQSKIEDLKVLIPGCGALGSVISEILVRLGVRKFRIIDFDFIEPSNYPRTQSIGLLDSLGRIPKVIACESLLRRINPFVEIESIYGWISPLNAESLVDGIDIVMDGLDNLKTRSFISRAAWVKDVPYIYSGVSDYYYNVIPLIPGKTPCFDCIFTVPEREEGGIPVLAPTVYTAAATAVMILLSIVKGIVEPNMIIGDAFNFSVDKIAVSMDQCECNFPIKNSRSCIIENIGDKLALFTSGIHPFNLRHLLRNECTVINNDKWVSLLTCGPEILSIYRDSTVICEKGNCSQSLNYIAGKLGCLL